MDRIKEIIKPVILIAASTILVAVAILLLGLLLIGAGIIIGHIAQIIESTGLFLRDLVIVYSFNTGLVRLQSDSIIGLTLTGLAVYCFRNEILNIIHEYWNQ